MKHRTPFSILKPIFVLTVFLLLCGGLHTVFGCSLQAQPYSKLVTRVDTCHLIATQTHSTAPCCQSEACHENTSTPQDLGNPEIHSYHKEPCPLVRESRQPSPHGQSGTLPEIRKVEPSHIISRAGISLAPTQALLSLRTVVLLH